MAETRQTKRGTFLIPPASWTSGGGGSIRVGSLAATPNLGTTILRSISFPSMRISVGAPSAGTPPENWWVQADLVWFIYESSDPTTVPPGYGDQPDVLFSGRLKPTFVASPSEAGAYYVQFEGPANGFQSRGMRTVAADTPQYLLTGLMWEDPLNGLDVSVFGDVDVWLRCMGVGIFGVPI